MALDFDADGLGFWADESAPTGARPDWQSKRPEVTTYSASLTCTRFHLDDSPIRGLMGPLGSGKSVACCMEIMQRAVRQPVDSTGKRRVRALVVRNTYRELLDTTVKTWFDWFPPEKMGGQWKRQAMTHEVRLLLADGTQLELDVIFRALDRPQDVRKLLSLEITFAWINEARELPLAVLRMLRRRCGRFPSFGDKKLQALAKKHEDEGVPQHMQGYWRGVIMDTNPPDEDHWWYNTFEVERPASWRLFRQPGGRSPQAENIENLVPGYYSDTGGHSAEWIRVYLDGEYGFVLDGKPVWAEYTDSLHCTDWADTLPNTEILVGLDFGLTPAAVFVQRDPRGRWRVIDELVATDMGVSRFADVLSTKIQSEYRDHQFRFYGDPAGEQRAQTDERTPFQILQAKGIMAHPARTNDFTLRREAVAVPLQQLIDGRPALTIHPRCKTLRKGVAGKYHYRRVQIIGSDRFHDKPDKGTYSHVCDALQYAMLSAGSDPRRAMDQMQHAPQAFTLNMSDWSPFDVRRATYRPLVPGVLSRRPAVLVGPAVADARTHGSRLRAAVGRLQLAAVRPGRRVHRCGNSPRHGTQCAPTLGVTRRPGVGGRSHLPGHRSTAPLVGWSHDVRRADQSPLGYRRPRRDDCHAAVQVPDRWAKTNC